jgi:hypothetical protein
VDYDLTRRAERAALGAMISDQRLAARLDCLVPLDFTDPRHRAVFQTVRLLSGTPQAAPGTWRDLVARTAGSLATREYLDDLAAACPDPGHGQAYAAILIQAAVYRLARDGANQIDARAPLPGYQGNRRYDISAAGARQAAGPGSHLAEVARALRRHTAKLAPETPDAAVGASTSGTDLQSGLAEAVRPFAGPRTDTVQTALIPGEPAPGTPAEHREELVLSALLQEHAQAGQVLAFLPAAAFTSPARQEIFRATRRLHHSGQPVDELTVGWELATHAAATAVLSPETARQPQVPDEYIDRLASTDIGTGQSPLSAARVLDAQLRYRAARQPAAGTAWASSTGCHVQARKPGTDQGQESPAPAEVPLLQPPNAVEARPAGPEQRR